MTVEVLATLDALQSFREEWLVLWRACPTATPFQSPQWLVPWMQHLCEGGQLWALALREESLVIGFAPLFCWGNPHRIVSFLGAGVSDYGDLLYTPGREADCVALVAGWLDVNHSEWDELDLQELRTSSPLLLRYPAQPFSICPALDLSTYPESMDRKHRTDVRRAGNKLEKLHSPCFTLENSNTETFFCLHAARWGAFNAVLHRFHLDVMQRFAGTGDLRLATLSIDGRDAAAIYAFRTRSTLFCYLSGYHPEMARLSPGAVLLGWLIERAIAEGVTTIDFLRDGESYKYLWGAKNQTNWRIHTADAANTITG